MAPVLWGAYTDEGATRVRVRCDESGAMMVSNSGRLSDTATTTMKERRLKFLSFYTRFQIEQKRFCFEIVLVHYDSFGEGAEEGEGDRTGCLDAYLCPLAVWLKCKNDGPLDATLNSGNNALIGDTFDVITDAPQGKAG